MSHRVTSVQCCWILRSGKNANTRCTNYTSRKYRGEPYCSRHIKQAELSYFGRGYVEEESEGEDVTNENIVTDDEEEDEIDSDDIGFIDDNDTRINERSSLSISKPGKDKIDISRCFEENNTVLKEKDAIAPSNIKKRSRKEMTRKEHDSEDEEDGDIDDDDVPDKVEPVKKKPCLDPVALAVASGTATSGYIWFISKLFPAFDIPLEFVEHVRCDPVLNTIISNIIETNLEDAPDISKYPGLTLMFYTAYTMFTLNNKKHEKVVVNNTVVNENNNQVNTSIPENNMI